MIVPGRLAWKFVVPIGALIIVTSATLGWFFNRHARDLVARGLVDRGTSLSRSLAHQLEYDLQFGAEERIQERLQPIITLDDVLYVIVQDGEGRVRSQAKAATLREIPPLGTPREERPDMVPPGQSTLVLDVRWEGVQVYEIVHPVVTRTGREREEIGLTLGGEDRRIGLTRVGMSLSAERVDARVRQVNTAVFLVTLIVILAGVGMAIVLVGVIVRPVRALASAAQRIGAGDLGSLVPVTSRDEIGDLAESFNRMAAALESRAAESGRLFRELDDTNRRLEAASRHKSQFLANMSHELRTPLNAIIGFSEILLNDAPTLSDEVRREFKENILNSGHHLLQLINDILDLSKIEAGKMKLAREPLNVPEVIEGVLATLRPLVYRKQLDLQTSIDPSFASLVADTGKIKQILYNLVSNAIKFTPGGGRIGVAAAVVGEEGRFTVWDTGIGIHAGEQERIFEEFHQVQATAGKEYEGTGLGLALARQLVHLHGGRIWVDSDPGKGSTFTFTIPLRGPAPAAPPLVSEPGGSTP